MTAEDCLIAENQDADPNEIRGFLARLNQRGIYLLVPEDTLPAGAVLMSEEDVVRETNPVVMAPDGQTPVVLSWGKTRLFQTEEPISDDND